MENKIKVKIDLFLLIQKLEDIVANREIDHKHKPHPFTEKRLNDARNLLREAESNYRQIEEGKYGL